METSEGYLTINGGTITVDAGGDGLDANTAIAQTGGDVVIFGPTNNGNGALDYGQSYEMTGGTLLAFGSTGMLQTISDSSSVGSVVYTGSMQQGSEISLAKESGDTLFTCKLEKQAASFIYASADLEDGASYTVSSGSSTLGTVTEGAVTGMGGMGGMRGMRQ